MEGNSTVANIDITAPSQDSLEFIHLKEATDFIGRYYIWVIFAFGFPGNLLSLFVIVRMSCHRPMSPLSRVVLACFGLLAVVDNIEIILKITENKLRYNGVTMSAASCKILYFLGLTLAAYPNWILIVMSAERFTAVRFPMKVGRIWSLKRTVIIISLVLFFLCLVHFHIFFSMTSKSGSCGIHPDFNSFYTSSWFFISPIVYAIIPAISLTVFNILTINILRASATRRRKSFPESELAVSVSRRQERQMTIMLVTVAVVFVILTIPRCIFVSFSYFWNPEANLDKMRKYFLNTFTSALADSNHAVNFYLYFISAKKFRKYLLEMISLVCPCVRRRYSEVPNRNMELSGLPDTNSSLLDALNRSENILLKQLK